MSTDTRTATDTNAVTLDRVIEADGRTTAPRHVRHAIRRAAFALIIGASGSGKSTTPHCAYGPDRPVGGSARAGGSGSVGGSGSEGRSETGLTRLRRDLVGFVFQRYPVSPR
ncbi:hypothetical protein KGQ20_08200 [Catenulispora sp. NF23]|uniref:ATP-binding protein n=1 Tax=Catenulispora pinistramenti TaxID=2705254 RepID=A0ABS5KQU0_9ACTN|nr:hypothetical protein [Catenulispora pinistramenti]MBS2532754.1 hypothetical protein [Catenulispora pinistramenti]MBS2548418.1 hypothetical protein [Catenulispora pinistramenti]